MSWASPTMRMSATCTGFTVSSSRAPAREARVEIAGIVALAVPAPNDARPRRHPRTVVLRIGGTSPTAASSNVAISLSTLAAAWTIGTARHAPVPSPSRSSRSSTGRRPRCASVADAPGSVDRCPAITDAAHLGRERVRDQHPGERDHPVDDDRDARGDATEHEAGDRADLQAADLGEDRHRVEQITSAGDGSFDDLGLAQQHRVVDPGPATGDRGRRQLQERRDDRRPTASCSRCPSHPSRGGHDPPPPARLRRSRPPPAPRTRPMRTSRDPPPGRPCRI